MPYAAPTEKQIGQLYKNLDHTILLISLQQQNINEAI